MLSIEVRNLENKNQFVVENDRERWFISYRSCIAHYNKSTRVLTLGCDWDYSNTTRKHLYKFIDGFVFREDINQRLENASNKRKEIQKMIDCKIIKYKRNMQ